MAQQLDWQKRRVLLNSHAPDKENCRQAARDCLADGFPSDAVNFFILAGDRDGLGGMIDQAVDDGDLFLLGRIKKALGAQASLAELEKLAANARRLGKETFAAQAEKQLEALKNPN